MGRSTSAPKGHPGREARAPLPQTSFSSSPLPSPSWPGASLPLGSLFWFCRKKGSSLACVPLSVFPDFLPHQADSLLYSAPRSPAPSTFSVFSSQSLRGVPSDCGLSPLFLHSKSTGLDVSRPGLWSCLFQQLPTDPGPPRVSGLHCSSWGGSRF